MWNFALYGGEKGDERRWNDFVAASRNATFLFNRGYMDYHADRFADHSVMAYKGRKLLALLPANLTAADRTLHSHQGLTYGGWLLPRAHVDGADVVALVEESCAWLAGEGIGSLDYKPVPYIYTALPAQDDLYALFRQGAQLSEMNLSAAVDLSAPRGFNALMRRHLRDASRLDVEIGEAGADVAPFWEMLAGCLAERHGASPVHSLSELAMLRERFPTNIRIFTAGRRGSAPMAGVCIFDTGLVAHCQYIASTPEGREANVLPLLFDHLINGVFAPTHRYFDFGTSNEEHGLRLNEGLLRQKASLGGTGVAYARYLLTL